MRDANQWYCGIFSITRGPEILSSIKYAEITLIIVILSYNMFHKETIRFVSDSAQLRLLAFYYFAIGFVPWYTIERLFQSDVLLLSGGQVILLINAAFISGLFFEIPSSVLADRWSRSRALGVSLIFASLAGLIGALSQNFWHMVVVSLCWAVASALHSGTSDALGYDILHEQKQTKRYPQVLAFYNQIFAFSLLLGSTSSGFLSTWFGYRAAYAAVLILMPMMAFLIFRMKEPHFHKANQVTTGLRHVGKSLKQIVTDKRVRWLASMTLVINYMIVIPVYEFLTYLIVGKGFGLVELGIWRSLMTNGVVLVFSALAAAYYRKAQQLVVPILVGASLFMYFATVHSGNRYIFALLFSIAFILQRTVSQWLQTGLQHYFKSSERATTTSLVAWFGGLAWAGMSIIVALRFSESIEAVYVLVSQSLAVLAIIGGATLFAYRKYDIFKEDKQDSTNEETMMLDTKG